MQWITRTGARLDRSAMIWLIYRYIDAQAEILYLPSDDVMVCAAELGATPFHHPEAALRHTGVRSGFDAMVDAYEIIGQDPAIAPMALVIRGAETSAREVSPYAAGLKALSNGICLQHNDDREVVALHQPILDALYAFCQAQLNPAMELSTTRSYAAPRYTAPHFELF